jgi:uncharacterized protein (DUF1697 family)
MTRYVALVRGINVSGRNKVPMAAWRAVAQSVGCTDVATYVQSGNLVCASSLAAPELATRLRAGLAEGTGVDVTCIVRTAAEWSAVVAGNPYPQAAAEGTTLHVTVLPGPAGALYDRVDPAAFAPETFALGESVLYLHLPGGMGTSRLAVVLERTAAGVRGTTRNWNTVLEIDRLLQG